MKYKVLPGLLLIAVIVIVCLFCNKCEHKSDLAKKDLIINAVNGELRKSVDKQGRETTRANIIVASYKELQNIHATDSSEIGRLKKLVDKRTTSAIVVSSTTSGSVSGVTSITIVDSLQRNCDTVFPEYKTSIHDKWQDFEITAKKDSIHLDYKIWNEYDYKQTIEKQGKWPFRKDVPIVQVLNLNPHTKTDKIASYAVDVPKSKNGRWFVAGGVTTAVIITVIKIFVK
jgi:hypothetical protein